MTVSTLGVLGQTTRRLAWTESYSDSRPGRQHKAGSRDGTETAIEED
ncbi:hypothetical protein HYQ46_013433 [Verticillium longisporum]|nr:hypothetical protein HYQ46_013433 [Verticillium longisporum]